MFPHANTQAALLLALAIALTACGKQDEQPAPAFPMGNGDKATTLADCDKLPDPKPADDSAASRGGAVAQGQAARAACKKEFAARQDKPNADLARIREIKEKEEADRAQRKVSEEEWKRAIKEGSSAPLREYKY